MVGFKETLKSKIRKLEQSNPYFERLGKFEINNHDLNKCGYQTLNDCGEGYIDFLDKNKKTIAGATAVALAITGGLTLAAATEPLGFTIRNYPTVDGTGAFEINLTPLHIFSDPVKGGKYYSVLKAYGIDSAIKHSPFYFMMSEACSLTAAGLNKKLRKR